MLEKTHTLTEGGSDINCHLRQQRGNLSPIRRSLGQRFEGKSALKVRSVGSVTPRQLYVGTTLTFRAVPHLSLSLFPTESRHELGFHAITPWSRRGAKTGM